MIEDDDLPVLTQVLRTGSGHAPAVDDPTMRVAAHGDARVEPTFARALVIGSDAEDDDLPPSYRAEAIADPRRIDVKGNDVFLRTAPTDEAYDESIDEPHFLAQSSYEEADAYTTVPPATPAASSQQMTTRVDVDAAFASEIRDTVLDELSSRIDTELDARIAQTLHAGLESALAGLQATLRAELAEALRDVVGHAVDDAIRRRLPSSSAGLH